MNELIITGAKEKNLKSATVTIHKNKITSVVGVSGSGKSALVFDTIAAESQRQLNETYTSFIRSRLPHYGKPDVESIQIYPFLSLSIKNGLGIMFGLLLVQLQIFIVCYGFYFQG